jgi:hypothetical protein
VRHLGLSCASNHTDSPPEADCANKLSLPQASVGGIRKRWEGRGRRCLRVSLVSWLSLGTLYVDYDVDWLRMLDKLPNSVYVRFSHVPSTKQLALHTFTGKFDAVGITWS